MANDNLQSREVDTKKPAVKDASEAHFPGLIELAKGSIDTAKSGLRSASHAFSESADGLKQLGEQTVNKVTGKAVFSKESIDALAPKEYEHAKPYTFAWAAEQVGAAAPLIIGTVVGTKLFGAAGAKEVLKAEQGSASVLERASSLSLRPTPLGLNVRNAAALGFGAEFIKPVDTKNDDSYGHALAERSINGTVGAISMAGMSLGTIGTQAAFKAVGGAVFKETAAATAESTLLAAESSASKGLFAKVADASVDKAKRVAVNSLIAGIGGIPGGALGYVAGSEVHGQSMSLDGLAQSAAGAGLVGGAFGGFSALRGESKTAPATDSAATAKANPESEARSSTLESARGALRDLLFGRQSDAGALGTAMASDVPIGKPEIKAFTPPGSTPVDVDAVTAESTRVRVKVSDEALREPTKDGFVKLLDAAKTSGTTEHVGAFFKAIDANPKILEGVKDLAGQTSLQSVKDLATMAEKPAVREAFSKLTEAAKDGSTDAQKQAFLDVVARDRSSLADLQKLNERYKDPRFGELLHKADVADIEIVTRTPQEAADLQNAVGALQKVVSSNGVDTADLNKLVRDDDSLVNLHPQMRLLAERLGGPEIVEKVNEAYAGRYETVAVHQVSDANLPRPDVEQTVSVRSNLRQDFDQMTQLVSRLDEIYTAPKEGDTTSPEWLYNVLKTQARTPNGQALEGVVKEYAQKSADPRFKALVNDAYLPAEGIISGPETTFRAGSEAEQAAFGDFAKVIKSWPKAAAGEAPTPAQVLDYRHEAFTYMASHLDSYEMMMRYGQQTNSSFEASAIDSFFGTKNLERFPGVLAARDAASAGDRTTVQQVSESPADNVLVNGSLDHEFKYADEVAKFLARPAVFDNQYSKRAFNDQPQVSQANPVEGARTWSVAEHDGVYTATVTGHPENLQQIIDRPDGTRIERYGQNGDTKPYVNVFFNDHTNLKIVDPSNGIGKFKLEYPLQGNYVTTDFPSGSPVAREVAWDGKVTQINHDGSINTSENANWKQFDPKAFDEAKRYAHETAQTEVRDSQLRALATQLVDVMNSNGNPAESLAAARELRPAEISQDQFRDYLRFAFKRSPITGEANYHSLDNNVSAIEVMRSKFVGEDYEKWSNRLKEYMTVPEVNASGKTPSGSEYPTWLGRQSFETMPNWLKSDVYQRFVSRDLQSAPTAVAEYFRSNPEPKELMRGRNGRPDELKPFRPIAEDSLGARMDRLSDLNIAKPEVTARLMELGAQDGSALQDVLRQMTSTRNNNVEFRKLMAATLPNAQDIYSVKLMLDGIDKARFPGSPDAEKPVDANIAKLAAESLTATASQASVAKDLVNKLIKGETTRPPFQKGPKPGPSDVNMLAAYDLTPPEARSTADVPDELVFGSAVKTAEVPADLEKAGSSGDAASDTTPSLKGGATTVETPVEQAAPVEQVAPVEHVAPVESVTHVEPVVEPSVETSPVVESAPEVATTTKLGANTLSKTAAGSEVLTDPSGKAWTNVQSLEGGQVWGNDGAQIWTNARGDVFDYDSATRTATARELPTGVSKQLVSFGKEATEITGVELKDDSATLPSIYASASETVVTNVMTDGGVEFVYPDGGTHTIGPRVFDGTDFKPSFEMHNYPGADGARGWNVQIGADGKTMGVLPNGVAFAAADTTGVATTFTYPQGASQFEPGTTAQFSNDTLNVNEPDGKQTVYHRNGQVEVYLPETLGTEGSIYDDGGISAETLAQLDRFFSEPSVDATHIAEPVIEVAAPVNTTEIAPDTTPVAQATPTETTSKPKRFRETKPENDPDDDEPYSDLGRRFEPKGKGKNRDRKGYRQGNND